MPKEYVWNVKKFGKRIEGQKKIIRFGDPIPVGAIPPEQLERLIATEKVIEKTVRAKKPDPTPDPPAAPLDHKKGKKDKKGGK